MLGENGLERRHGLPAEHCGLWVRDRAAAHHKHVPEQHAAALRDREIGLEVVVEQVGIDFSSISKMIITGGFGQFLDIEKAITIGLLPDIDRDKFQYMGNSSIAGAYMALLSNTYRQQAISISNAMTYIDFSSNNAFMDEFTRAQFLPHTDANLFPDVVKNII